MLRTLRALLHTSDIRAYPLYSATIFLSAFLLFQVQPMIGRYMLPFFGGSVSVWGASLVFFTTALFLGYLYVYLLSGYSGKTQIKIHSIFLAIATAFVGGVLLFSSEPYVSLDWVFGLSGAPAVQVLLALLVAIGIPYILLSATGPLLQHWYAHETGREPYHLYALSNIGSFLALGTYPFIIEPLFGLSTQQSLWAVFFLLCVGLLFATARAFKKFAANMRPEDHETEPIPLKRLAAWLGLAALPTVMLVATTAKITQTLVPVPFIWVMPLALYLLSFILAFRGKGSGGLIATIVALTAGISFVYLDYNYANVPRQILAVLALFFFGSWYCHALLYKMRPSAFSSSFFYVWLSLGGAVGTLITTMIAPVLFVDYLEFTLGLAMFALVAIGTFPAMKYLRDEYERHGMAIKLALAFVIIVGVGHFLNMDGEGALYASRNFYGTVEVHEYETARYLYHGTTLHGLGRTEAGFETEATTYYTPTSGVGRAIAYARGKAGKEPISVGVVGLGTGTLASYCQKGDKLVYYEIDPRMGEVANQYFPFINNCPQLDIRYGDGRLVMERELERGRMGEYDVLAIDAFSDDTIPVHLLTKEAVELYFEHLRDEDSIIAIHTSNRFFELSPVVERIARELGVAAVLVGDDADDNPYGTSSQWVLLSRSAEALEAETIAVAVTGFSDTEASLWTDNYANVFGLLQMPPLFSWGEEEE